VLPAAPAVSLEGGILNGNPDHQAAEREAVLTLSALIGAISIAGAVDAPGLSEWILTNAAAALKQTIPKASDASNGSAAKTGRSHGSEGRGHHLGPAPPAGVPSRTWSMAVMMILADPSMACATRLDGSRS